MKYRLAVLLTTAVGRWRNSPIARFTPGQAFVLSRGRFRERHDMMLLLCESLRVVTRPLVCCWSIDLATLWLRQIEEATNLRKYSAILRCCYSMPPYHAWCASRDAICETLLAYNATVRSRKGVAAFVSLRRSDPSRRLPSPACPCLVTTLVAEKSSSLPYTLFFPCCCRRHTPRCTLWHMQAPFN